MRTIEVNDVFSVVLIKQLICGSEIQLKFKKSAKETGIISLSVVGIVSHNLTIKKFPKILVKGMFLGILGHVKYNRIFCLLHDALSNIEIGRFVNVQELIMVNNGIIILYVFQDYLWPTVVKTQDYSGQMSANAKDHTAECNWLSSHTLTSGILMKFKANRENVCPDSILYILI